MPMPHYTAIVTLLAVGFYFFTGIAVARARVKFGIMAPATAGHPDFERVFRVQMNTLEWMPLFLPSLWLFALYVSDAGAAAIGVVWVLRAHIVLPGLHDGGGEAWDGVWHSSPCGRYTLCWRTRGHRGENCRSALRGHSPELRSRLEAALPLGLARI